MIVLLVFHLAMCKYAVVISLGSLSLWAEGRQLIYSLATTGLNAVLWYIEHFLWILYLMIIYFKNLQGDIL